MKTLVFFVVLVLSCVSIQAQKFDATSTPVQVEVGAVATPAVVVTKDDPMLVTLESLGLTNLPKYHALIIGVSEYKHAGPKLVNLDMPAKDAAKLYQILIDKYSFNKDDVRLLQNPTREEIINQFDHLAENVQEKDNVLIFYAGHGVYDKAKDFGYWLPSDARPDSRGSWIPNSTIKDYMGAIRSKHTLLITDACFGGSIFKTRSVDAIIRRIHEMYKDKSRKAMTSGNLSEVPDKSVFIQYLLKSLDENTDPAVGSSSLFSRMYEPILNNSPTTPQFGVIQGAGDEGGDFIFFKKK